MPYCLNRCLTSFSESTPSGASTVVIAGEGLLEYKVRPSACIPERADGVDHQDRTGPRGDLRQLADGMVDAGGALVRLDVYALRLGVLAQGLLDGNRIDRMAPLALQGDCVHPVRLRQLSPALAE